MRPSFRTWFVMVDRHTANDRSVFVDPDPFYGPGYVYGGWRPYWRFHGAWGWRAGRGDPFWDDYTVTEIDRYQATADIAVFKGPKPGDNPHAFDARQIMSNLGPTIVRPS